MTNWGDKSSALVELSEPVEDSEESEDNSGGGSDATEGMLVPAASVNNAS